MLGLFSPAAGAHEKLKVPLLQPLEADAENCVFSEIQIVSSAKLASTTIGLAPVTVNVCSGVYIIQDVSAARHLYVPGQKLVRSIIVKGYGVTKLLVTENPLPPFKQISAEK